MPGTALEAGYNDPRKKIHLGRKARKMLKKNPLTTWTQKAGIGQKEEKTKQNQQSEEPAKSSQLFSVGTTDPLTAPSRRTISAPSMFGRN